MHKVRTKASSVAVVGCGYWGKNLVRNFQELGVLAAICDSTPQGRKLAKELVPGVPIVEDFATLLKTSIDAVVIATPAETHHLLAEQALDAGKDVFVEKPLALNHSEAEQLVKQAHANQRILMVGHVLGYHPAIVKLSQIVHDGDLGKVRYIYSNRLSLGKVRPQQNIPCNSAPHSLALILHLI